MDTPPFRIPEAPTNRVFRCETVENIVLAALAKGHTRQDAAKMAGVAYATVAKWRRRDSTFAMKMKEAIDQGRALHTRRIIERLDLSQ